MPMLVLSIYIWAIVGQTPVKAWGDSHTLWMGLFMTWVSVAPIFALIAIIGKSDK
jgi:hypothetical protein